MSFTGIVKNEATKLEQSKNEKISEISAIIQNATLSKETIKITTENASVARLVFRILKELYQINAKIIVRKGYNYSKNYLYILETSHHIQTMLTDLGIYNHGKIQDIPKSYIVDDIEVKKAYLRGTFIITGSVNDPKKSRYHLEFLVSNKLYADFLSNLLNEFYLNSKVLKRDTKYMVYIKEAEKIGDFLRIIGTTNALFYYEDIRIYRDHKNMTNRLNNCEQANVDRMIATSNAQIKDIELITKAGGLELLDEKEKIVAEYRLKYTDASLQELSEIITMETGKEISKSGLHHRFNKIKTLANTIRKKQK